MAKLPSDQIKIEEASSFRDYLFLRRLRNQVRHQMTNDTESISYLRQIKFFWSMKRKAKATAGLRIFIARHGSRPVGYLLAKTMDGIAIITEAVDPHYRRQGVGRELIAFAQRHYSDIVAEIREDNEASIALHRSMNFLPERRQNGIAIYRFCK